MLLKINPIDTLFFRDGKPFTGGAETWASGIFPPLPSTFYGAMRTLYISACSSYEDFINGKLSETIGTPDHYGSLRIHSAYLTMNDKRLYPLPYDLVSEKNSREKTAVKMEPLTLWNMVNSTPVSEIIYPQNMLNAVLPEKSFLSEISLAEYLTGKEKEFSYYTLDDISTLEPKIGIKKDRQTYSSQEGFLYRVAFRRMNKDCGFQIDFSGIADYPAQGIMRLGGEAKAVKAEKLKEDHPRFSQHISEIKNQIDKNKKFKLYLATPAIFTKGSLPGGMENHIWVLDDLKIRLLTMAIGKPGLAGGWDIQKRQPKMMYRTVPAGSVYYFEIIEGTSSRVIEKFHYQNISDQLSQEGFGLTLVAGV